MHRTLCGVNAADAGSVTRCRCQSVCVLTLSDRKIGRTVRSTCVDVPKLCESTRMRVIEVYTEGPQGRTYGREFRNTCSELLDPGILSAAKSIRRPLKYLHSCAKHYARTVLLCVTILLSSCWILKI